MLTRRTPGLWGPAIALAATLMLTIPGCGDDGSGGTAGETGPSTVGGLCANGCGGGLFCSYSSRFANTCTAACNGPGDCALVEPLAKCIGTLDPECGFPCTDDDDCSAGTTCGERDSTMVCVAN